MTDERRDRWGETAGERHDRILARDLAWVSYSADPDMPSDGSAYIAFNAGYAAAHETARNVKADALEALIVDLHPASGAGQLVARRAKEYREGKRG